jgi:hypothetical protein
MANVKGLTIDLTDVCESTNEMDGEKSKFDYCPVNYIVNRDLQIVKEYTRVKEYPQEPYDKYFNNQIRDENEKKLYDNLMKEEMNEKEKEREREREKEKERLESLDGEEPVENHHGEFTYVKPIVCNNTADGFKKGLRIGDYVLSRDVLCNFEEEQRPQVIKYMKKQEDFVKEVFEITQNSKNGTELVNLLVDNPEGFRYMSILLRVKTQENQDL